MAFSHSKQSLLTRSNYKPVENLFESSATTLFSAPDGSYDSAVTVRVRSAWKKFREYLPILTGKGFLLKLKSRYYVTCVRSCLMHGSETWPMKVENELKLNRTEMSMIRWMCGVKLNERKKIEELRELLGLEPVSLMIKKSRLRWFGVDTLNEKLIKTRSNVV